MELAFTEEQEALRETARAFLAEHSSSEHVRRAMATEAGFEPEVWKRMGSELGWPAVIVPEAYGGLGLTWVELVALLEGMGEALLCAPYFSTVCLAANAILAAGTDAQQRAYLPGIAEGRTRATLTATSTDAAGPTARRDGAHWVLSGRERHVLDGHGADLLVVAAGEARPGRAPQPARQPEPAHDAGPGRAPGPSGSTPHLGLFLVPADTPGLARRALPTLDPTRRLAEIELADVRLPADARLGTDADAAPARSRALDRAAIALAAEQVGGAQRCLDLAVAHARQRVQFGRPIGSFQAIQHRCADMMLRVEAARSAAYYAACVAAEGRDELPLVASLAKAYASEAYFFCAAECLQIHGGVGFTWEYDVHLHLKRARAGEAFLGTPAQHRERVAQRLLDAPA